MPVTRLALLLLILAGVTLFALQNWLPVLPLVILGTQTQALPLAVWMVGAIAAGAVTTLVVAVLFRLANFTTPPQRRRPGKRAASPPLNPTATPSWNSTWEQTPTPASSASSSRTSNPDQDWEQSRQRPEEWEDWEGYQEPVEPPPSPAAQTTQTARTAETGSDLPPIEEKEDWEDWEDYEDLTDDDRSPADSPTTAPSHPIREVQPEPRTYSQSGSVYSYSYRDPHNSGVGKTESVYDADYRVITPPYRPETEAGLPSEVEDLEAEEEEDWDLDENDFEANDPSGDRSRRRSDPDW